MKVVGIVRWRNHDKAGNPIAGVEPLFELEPDKWRAVNAAEEFPTQGQVFWPFAREAAENQIIFFRAEDNRGQKDEFRVVEPHLALEIIDLRRVGSPSEVRAALTAGVRGFDACQGLVLVRCAPDLFVGPVRLNRSPAGGLTLDAAARDRVPCHSRIASGDIRTLRDGRNERTILAGPHGTASLGTPTGYVDWDDDKLVFRRALAAAVARARRTGPDPGLTKRLIDEAADSLAGDGGGAELQLERFRLERARILSSESALITTSASELASLLMGHPSVITALDNLKRQALDDLEASMRSEIEQRLAALRRELQELEETGVSAKNSLEETRAAIQGAEKDLADSRLRAQGQEAELESALAARLAELRSRPAEWLADVLLLRPFLAGATDNLVPKPVPEGMSAAPAWRAATRTVTDRAGLQRAFATTFKSRGLSPVQALRLHAAVVSNLLPIVSGPGAVDALLAYAQVVCGGRTALLHVAADWLRPMKLDGSAIGPIQAAATGFAAPSLLVFEGANRGPMEAYLAPLLQVHRVMSANGPVGLHSPLAGAVQFPRSLCLAATVTDGATALPVSRDLWAHAVALHMDRAPAGHLLDDSPSEVALSSELLQPGEPPLAVVEAVIEACPYASEVDACLRAYASALVRFESDHKHVLNALIECVMLPLVVTLPEAHERDEALEQLQRLVPTRGDDGLPPLGDLAKQLRRRLA